MEGTNGTRAEDASPERISLEVASEVFKITLKNETETTPHLFSSNPKKRKVINCDMWARKNLLTICSSTPQASSTLNDSFTQEFENIKIEASYITIDRCDEGPASKLRKSNTCEKLVTPPSTPESHFKSFDSTPKKASIFARCSSACSIPSPLKEQHDILYPTLKPLDQSRKILTPQKLSETPNRKKCVAEIIQNRWGNRLLYKIINNDVIMGEVFSYLSNGDLFRFSEVSREFKDALFRNPKASLRCDVFQECHKINKENYKITPPSSPESQTLFPEGSISPNRQKFAEFAEIGSHLNPTQSLTKCPKCTRPSIVEDHIAQCQEGTFCGYIFCQKCSSFSYNPKEFYDKCRGLTLGCSPLKRRPKLEDLTNSSLDFNISTVFNSTAENGFSSGYYSGCDSTHSPLSVKRNLNSSLSNSNDSLLKSQKVLFESNRSLSTSSIKREDKRRSSGSIKPIVRTNTVKRRIEICEPSSPPKGPVYSACSKESRRSLKRLTR
ncbi:uncharacterized protein [Euwallacea similis]|uniref:uncharacterized protein n=1 Tax=Euwallacea similis TaxID=1736056 RepID=UPI003450D9CD